ncbi:hypothetical protein [Nocardia paucivorans]|uniref:hypothetical protein n=1 Tax=Nocardia paucivorans TaxID=114259 RepID=UPI0012F91D45|nr:hypothetical protein [Nocardia paucivorans]
MRTNPETSVYALGVTHRTEVDVWQAIWFLERRRIRTIRVDNISEPRTLLSVTIPADAPDLADMRERLPNLTPLWDAVRHEFWTKAVSEDLAI